MARRLKDRSVGRIGAWSVALVFVAAQPAAGQAPGAPPSRPLVVTGRTDLRFGQVLRGMPTVVPSDDHRRAGLFEIRGERGIEIRVDFILPAAMVSSSGDQMPLVFGPGDGLMTSSRGNPRGGVAFDPRAPLVTPLTGPGKGNAPGRVFLRLGGTAAPTQTQPPGAYSGTVTVTITQLTT